MARTSDLIESMAIAGAVACLAHCLALPLVIAALPALASVVPIPTEFHIMLLLFAVPTTLFALIIGYRHHGTWQPLLAGLCGLALLAIGVLTYGETRAEVPLTIAGSLTIAAAHLINWRHRRICAG
ncbi:uncharacterized protein (DUF697 family) [Sphingomonas vulcanisoli]|uniref:Uncharacterized protein (DUF697 family) n=1 Tax=Sphingomonas vulcanisoli TaxID=1658060 RepID=A0ABX0TTD4_9SPHN|nr:MerC domain-containing protein [Sphingomonas vulcanisoli]NIJ08783.1 uncharacterized protein (DUF697 family) [Sphingomonas vulcanisoli]